MRVHERGRKPTGLESANGTTASWTPSPIVQLNRAVAVAYTDGNAAGLAALEEAARDDALKEYLQFYVARAELLRRLDRPAEAAHHYRQALERSQSQAERRHIGKKLSELGVDGFA